MQLPTHWSQQRTHFLCTRQNHGANGNSSSLNRLSVAALIVTLWYSFKSSTQTASSTVNTLSECCVTEKAARVRLDYCAFTRAVNQASKSGRARHTHRPHYCTPVRGEEELACKHKYKRKHDTTNVYRQTCVMHNSPLT